MRLQIERKRIDLLSRIARGFLRSRDSKVLTVEGLTIDFQEQVAMVVVTVTFQDDSLLIRQRVRCLNRCALYLLHGVQIIVSSRSGNDIGDGAAIERAGVALVVMDVTGKDGIRDSPAILYGLIEDILHVGAAAVIGIRRIDGVMHRDDQCCILRRGAQFRLKPGNLIVVHPAAFRDVGVQADERHKGRFQRPVDVGLSHGIASAISCFAGQVGLCGTEILDERRQRGDG